MVSGEAVTDCLVNHGFRLSYAELFDDAVEVIDEAIRILTELHEHGSAAAPLLLARARYAAAGILHLARRDPVRARTDAATARRLLLSFGQPEVAQHHDFLERTVKNGTSLLPTP